MEEPSAKIVPCEIDGDVMYVAGQILHRGQQVGESDGEPIYEWLPEPPASAAPRRLWQLIVLWIAVAWCSTVVGAIESVELHWWPVTGLAAITLTITAIAGWQALRSAADCAAAGRSV